MVSVREPEKDTLWPNRIYTWLRPRDYIKTYNHFLWYFINRTKMGPYFSPPNA